MRFHGNSRQQWLHPLCLPSAAQYEPRHDEKLREDGLQQLEDAQ